ncbi:unnamed protein product [Penicillium palitans]
MESFPFLRGDSVVITERNGKDTVLIVVSNDDLEDGYAYVKRVVRDNLRVRQGDVITIHPCLDSRYVRRIVILPTADSVEGFTGSLFDVYLAPYFRNAYRPVRQGDRFTVRGDKREVEFKIVEVEPAGYGVVAEETIIHCG